MEVSKAELLLGKFEENISLEKFFLDQSDEESLIRVLREQEDLLPVLLSELELLPPEGNLWSRLQLAADARQEQANRVSQLLGEISKELGRLRQSAKRLHDWQKAWQPARGHGVQLTNTYA